MRKIVVLILIVLLTGVLCYFALTGAAWGIYEIRPLHEQVPRGLDLTGGVAVVYEANDLNSPELAEDINSVISAMRIRLDADGYTEATIVKQGTGRIRIEIPINETNMVDDPSAITQYLVQPALIEFVDPDGNVLFTGADMVSVSPALVEGQYVVSFKLNESATVKFAQATSAFINQTISIRLDGTVISSPLVKSVIGGGEAVIEGGETPFTAQQVTQLSNQIRSGALPIEMEEIEVRSVSATLGEEALSKGITAALIGLALVFVFMAMYYRLPGLMADLALVIYVLLMLLCLATINGIQLTLPGVAGIILSIGMAVDANVVIFERMREEIKSGKTIRTSVRNGFKRAFSAILDSNITTVIAALVLLLFGTGSIKGFAVTLLIGIVLSFITSVFITRGLVNLLMGFHFQNKSLFCPTKMQPDETARPEGGNA
ncbi:MAG: protein translocase subunit SecD [Clostridiales bacterium]|nr:protein translocase subunit SecD [Clostridiales bacterium]